MGDFAIIQRSPGGLGGYATRIGITWLWTSGGVDHAAEALTEEAGVKGAAAVRFKAVVLRALAAGGGKFALVALPEKRKARKRVRP